MKNGRHLEFCKMIMLIVLSEYQDYTCISSSMKIHQIVPDLEHSQEQNIHNLLINQLTTGKIQFFS